MDCLDSPRPTLKCRDREQSEHPTVNIVKVKVVVFPYPWQLLRLIEVTILVVYVHTPGAKEISVLFANVFFT